MSVCEYELQREQRMAENRRRMEEMGIIQMSEKLRGTVQRQPKAQRRASMAARPPRALVDAPKRRSSRLDGKPATNYNENALELADRPERKSRSSLLDRHVISQEEMYTEEHVKLLGDCKEPWELFKDGYDAAGNRVYDKVAGMTCHQCRQKTLGRHTSCSKCQTLHGVFCGDCLFMRYGENIQEVEAAAEPWVCPPCRGLCNCSFHRIRNGWAPTGTLYRRAISEGYKSVAHYLVLTKLASAAAADAAQPVSAQPASAGAAAGTDAAVDMAADAVQPPQQQGNSANAAAPAAGASPPAAAGMRQAQIDAILPRARRGRAATKAGAKALSKLAQPAGVPKGLGRGLGKEGKADVQAADLGRLTRTAAAVRGAARALRSRS